MNNTTRGRRIAAVLLVAPLAGCNLIDAVPMLGDALKNEQGSATYSVGELLPGVEQAAIVCPYSGFQANEYFGTEVFKSLDDASERANWLVSKRDNGALVNEELSMDTVALCMTGAGIPDFRELNPADTLVFEERDGRWELVRVD